MRAREGGGVRSTHTGSVRRDSDSESERGGKWEGDRETLSLGWVRFLMPPNGLLVRILQIQSLGTALPFKPSNSFTIPADALQIHRMGSISG